VAEKAANAERLKTPLTEDLGGSTTNTEEQHPDPVIRLPTSKVTGDTAPQGPAGTHTEDPKILPDKVTTLEGDDIEDFTLSDEGEGDNTGGNKELRQEGDEEDENNSKRAKVPL